MTSITDLLLNQEYQACKVLIDKWRQNKVLWEDIFYARKGNDEGLAAFLESKQDEEFWTITVDEWHLLVSEMKKIDELGGTGFIGDPKKALLGVPAQPGSCWVKYKNKLSKPGSNFTYLSISNIEKSSQKIISHLNSNTTQEDPVRGMVVGNVQSGKTANMSGVIAMAADYGYNFFIILTGTIDNLRKQTRERLINDLNYDNCNCVFKPLDYLSAKTINPDRLQDLHLSDKSKERYLTVCLKNSARLRDLLNWMNMNPESKEKLKVLLIDDEADQAGINTGDIDKEEQTKISKLIKNIVFGKNSKDQKAGPYQCMNYIGYTATPYANFLNESGNDTLYPKNFISLLNAPPEYMGPQQIFGVDGVNNGLNIVNKIEDEEIDYINDDSSLLCGKLPASLEESLLWFTCTVAIIRYWELKRSVSMLIHTSQKVDRHFDMQTAITSYFKNINLTNTMKRVEDVYTKQTSQFTLESFKENMPDYNEIEKVRDYPSFEEIKDEIEKILLIGVSHITLDDDGSKLNYNNGLHLCVDNCKKNPDNNEFQMRIVYPDKKDKIMEKSPAFIVIGGSTLSRGLTLDGLTTSYFLRSTSQADTLMQMGRWFGYRTKYELMPRIWLSNQTTSRFNRLTKLDYDLRNELDTMEIKGLCPKDYAPRLDSFPDYKLLVLTAKNKMQSSTEYSCTFYNKSAETTWFYRDQEIVDKNYAKSIEFLNSLGKVDKNRIKELKNPSPHTDPIMWFDVDYNKVLDFIGNLIIPSQSATFSEIEKLKDWFDKNYQSEDISNFTVIAGGLKEKRISDLVLESGDVIHIQSRMRREYSGAQAKDYDKYIDLATISQPDDRLLDIDCSKLKDFEIEEIKNNKINYLQKRTKYASNNTPLLIVYLIDKESGKDQEAKETSKYKRLPLCDLNLNSHIVGYYIYIPYGKYDSETDVVTVKLNYDEKEESSNETKD